MKSVFRSKTFWFNVVFVLVTVANALGFAEFVPADDAQQIAVVVVAVVNLVLRLWFTDTAITQTHRA